MGETGEEVGPGQRAGVGIGDVDLELGNHHEDGRRRHRPAVVGKHVFPGHEVHLVRVHGPLRRNQMADGEPGQQGAAEHLDHARHHPARPAHQDARPPAAMIGPVVFRHEAQVVHLLAHLGDHRQPHRHGGTEQVNVEARGALAGIADDAGKGGRLLGQQEDIGQHQHDQPDGLGDRLQLADDGDAVGDQRNHHQGADQVAPGRRDAEGQLQGVGHDGRFEREEDEGERRVDQRRDGGAEIAEAGAPRQQVHVQPVAGRVDAHRQAHQENDQPRREDGQRGVDEAVIDQQRRAHRLQHQEGGRAKRRVGHPRFRPLAIAAWREAQGVILHGLVGHPGVVVAADFDNTLKRLRRIIPGRLLHRCAAHALTNVACECTLPRT